jgi:hypothetical protein
VAPALIQETTMLPGNNEELAKSMSFAHFLCVVDARKEIDVVV